MFSAKFKSLLQPNEKVTAEQLETDRRIMAFDRSVNEISRRKFTGGFMGAIALVVGGGFIETPKGFGQTTTPPITDVLNFALNLEYLEANLYSIVTTGNPISASLMGSAPGTITGSPGKLTLSSQLSTSIFQALVQDETNHINLLRETITSLGGTPISMPNINYGAKGTITTEAQLYATTRQFTATGNGAYAGAAQFLVSNPTVLTVASQILSAEGQHLGVVDFAILNNTSAAGPQTAIDLQDTIPTTTQYFDVFVTGAANANTSNQYPALAPARTTSQDLGIVYGVSTATTLNPTTGVKSGGFFPNGVNGNITTT